MHTCSKRTTWARPDTPLRAEPVPLQAFASSERLRLYVAALADSVQQLQSAQLKTAIAAAAAAEAAAADAAAVGRAARTAEDGQIGPEGDGAAAQAAVPQDGAGGVDGMGLLYEGAVPQLRALLCAAARVLPGWLAAVLGPGAAVSRHAGLAGAHEAESGSLPDV